MSEQTSSNNSKTGSDSTNSIHHKQLLNDNATTNASILHLNNIKTSYHAPESIYNLETVYNNNTRFATENVLPPDDYHSPYYIPFKNVDDPRPVDQLIYRFSIWKMIIKQIVFYFKEMCVFKSQTYQGNRAMLENLEILKRQNSGKLKTKANANKVLKNSDANTNNNININNNNNNSSSSSTNLNDNFMIDEQNIVNKLLQTTFLPPGEMSILSISSTFFNNHNYLKERELLTYQQLTNRLIPRLENLKDQLNETIKQMTSIKNSSDFKTKNLKMEIAKTGGILSDYITSIELLKTGKSKSSLGTNITLKDNKIDPKLDPYILKLNLDLQLKDQLYIEAHLKEIYYDLQFKSVQLEKILYTEIQSCISSYTDLIDSELKAVKDNLIQPFKDGFIKNNPTCDWDYFIRNDKKKNFLPINAKNTLEKVKKVRKNSEIIYPYKNSVLSSCIFSGYLERKSKFLKNYSKFFYVLTINFLHEFKSNDRIKDLHPIQSFSLSDLKISTVDNDPKKFVIRIYKNSNENEAKTKFTLKSDNIDSTIKWIDYLSDLTEFENTIERNLTYDENDDDDDDQNESFIKSTEQNNFINDGNTIYDSQLIQNKSPQLSSNESYLSHSRSISDELFFKSQDNLDNNKNIGNVSFKSIKNQNIRQPSASSLPVSTGSNSRNSSRNSSRSSSRASSPSRIRNNIRIGNSGILSPKLNSANTTPTGIGSSTASNNNNNNNVDYFSYAPRKVQASIIRNGNRLASSSTGRLTPGTGGSIASNGNTSSLSLNTKNLSSSVADMSKLTLNAPIINIQDSSPINPAKPNIISFDKNNNNNDNNNDNDNDNDNDTYNDNDSQIEKKSGLERRKKTLSEKLDITGLVSANKLNGNKLLNLPPSGENLNSTFRLPQTPGIIPGSMMSQVFDSQNRTDVNNNNE